MAGHVSQGCSTHGGDLMKETLKPGIGYEHRVITAREHGRHSDTPWLSSAGAPQRRHD
jgi:hypothetical protein